MHRACLLTTLGGALLVACGTSSTTSSSLARLVVAPILDSIFVGDTVTPLTALYLNASGQNAPPPGPVRWASSDTTIAKVDSVSARLIGAGRGAAVITATSAGFTANALVVVSRPLDLALLLDTIYLMPGDTITIPVAVERKGGSAPAPWFTAPTNAVFTVDSAGLARAQTAGGPIPYVAHVALPGDTLADTGQVDVMVPPDTLHGRAFYSVLGTIILRTGSPVQGLNYTRSGDTLTFRLQASLLPGTTANENVVVTLRDSLSAPGTFPIDSLSLLEAAATAGSPNDPVCHPARPWAFWSRPNSSPAVAALSRHTGGAITITQLQPIPSGLAVSGRFHFLAQRTDIYYDPLGLLAVQGTFVAPLITNRSTCP